MTYDLLCYVVPKYDIGVDEIPIVVEWEIDEVPAGYPSALDPFEEATEPRPLVCEVSIHGTERNLYRNSTWEYVEKHEGELMKEVQESTALWEAFNDVIDDDNVEEC